MKDVYINRIEKFLPNDPVSNDEMEAYLGLINGNESKSRGLILRSNKIKTRHYAIDKNGKPTHNNAQLTVEAINKLFDKEIKLSDIELLTAGTSSPDNIQPSHASMVHGELGGHPMEVMSAHGTCNAAMLSLKYAYMSIQTGAVYNAVCAGSEIMSQWMHARNFENEIDRRKEIEKNPYIAFEKDFLRWMLSDGSSAVLLQNKPNKKGLSLKIDWIENASFANELEACMYAGCVKEADGSVKGWRELSMDEQSLQSVFSLKQDARLLQKHIVPTGIALLKKIIDKRNLNLKEVDYFLPHISSMFFKNEILRLFAEANIDLPEEKWFINLTKVGNIGAASAFFMLEELFHSGNLKKGEHILVMVPESARFSHTYMYLTVVEA
ncbi:MAG TPA: beta-ketoacyl-ACP synthase III [Bacteroidales bacterium]